MNNPNNGETQAGQAERSPFRARTEGSSAVDRSDAPDDQFALLLARIEATPTVDAGQDARVETVARALWEVERPAICGGGDDCCTWESLDYERRNGYRVLAAAALAAMHPAHETLRAKVEALADEWTSRAMHQGGWYEAHYQSLATRLRAVLGGEL